MSGAKIIAGLQEAVSEAKNPRAKSQQHEYRLQCAIVRAAKRLLNPGVLLFAIPNGEKRTLETFSRIAAMGGRRGLPDLQCIVNGIAIGMEVKTAADKLRGIPRGVQSADQAAVECDWTEAGGIFRVVYGFDEAMQFLFEVGATRASTMARVLV